MGSLDIFQKLPGGVRRWVCSTGSLQEAKGLLLRLQRNEPAAYYVCDLNSRKALFASTEERPELHAVWDDDEFFGRRVSGFRNSGPAVEPSRLAAATAENSPVVRWRSF